MVEDEEEYGQCGIKQILFEKKSKMKESFAILLKKKKHSVPK